MGTYGALRSRRRRLMVAKAVIMGLAPGTIIAAIIADHIATISNASTGVHDGSMPFIDMFLSRHIAASISSMRMASWTVNAQANAETSTTSARTTILSCLGEPAEPGSDITVI